MQDLYEILGVSRSASDSELKSAYRKLAMRYHPDRNPGDSAAEKRFKEINAAYEVLKDSQRREQYDRFGRVDSGSSPFGDGGGFDFNGFSDVFDSIFGGINRQESQQPRRGADTRLNIKLSLHEAFTGSQRDIKVRTKVTCGGCSGTGLGEGSRTTTCGECRGTGRMRLRQGFITFEQTCPRCRGKGQTIENPCQECSGQGRTTGLRNLSIAIPPGVDNGTQLRVRNEGEAGQRGAKSGDMIVHTTIEAHDIFMRDGNNLICRYPVSMTTAAIGGTIDVPVIDGGSARVTIPPGSQPGRVFRLRQKGMNVLNGGGRRGDMLIEIQVEIPVNLSSKQRELLKEFDDHSKKADNQAPTSSGFGEKLKRFWSDLQAE